MTKSKQLGWILMVLAGARIYYEAGMGNSGSSTTQSLLSALDFGGSGAAGGISLFTAAIGAGGVWILLKK